MNKHRDFETIYRATFNALSKHVYFKVAKLSDAEDIVQDLFIKFWDEKIYLKLETAISGLDP